MTDPLRYNIFRFAKSELSHSAFWAWVLDCADASEGALGGPRKLARALLERLGVKEIRSPVEVRTEVKIAKGCRIDIQLRCPGTLLVIENKVSAIPSESQLQRYLVKLAKTEQLKIAIISTAFDDDVRPQLSWTYLGADDLHGLVKPYAAGHQLIADYFRWLSVLTERRAERRRQAHSSDPGDLRKALRTAEGQWALMGTLTEKMRGTRHRGVNLDGSPWTQHSFVAGQGHNDSLFYRIDVAKTEPYFALRQYQRVPSPSWEAKRQRREILRSLWKAALEETRAELKPAKPSPRGRKESEVATFEICTNPPESLGKWLPLVHDRFLAKLGENGWPTT